VQVMISIIGSWMIHIFSSPAIIFLYIIILSQVAFFNSFFPYLLSAQCVLFSTVSPGNIKMSGSILKLGGSYSFKKEKEMRIDHAKIMLNAL